MKFNPYLHRWAQKSVRYEWQSSGSCGLRSGHGYALMRTPQPALWPRIAVAIAIILFVAAFAQAGPREQAYAKVAVAIALMQDADSQADIQDAPPRPSNPRAGQDATGATEGARADEDTNRDIVSGSAVEKAYENAIRTLAGGMQLEPSKSGAPMESPKLSATIYSTKGCIPCKQLQRRWGNGNEDVELTWIEGVPSGPQLYPAIRFRDASGGLRYPSNDFGDYKQITDIDQLVDLVAKHQGLKPVAQSAFGNSSAGTIHARKQISDGISQFRKFIGEGNVLQLSLSCNRPESLDLRHSQDWTTKDLWGSEGQVRIRIPEQSAIPIREFSTAYRIVGEDVAFDPGEVLVRGATQWLSPSRKQSYGATPAGIIGIDDMLFCWSIVSMIRDIAAIMRPSCDLILPADLNVSIVLNGDAITAKFDTPPEVKLVWLFTFRLKVTELIVSSEKVIVNVSGSRFVKQRTFAVQ